MEIVAGIITHSRDTMHFMIQFHHKMGEASSEPANVITKPHWYVFIGVHP